MTHRVVIEARYCGPPGSGNGGYTCGVTARALGGSDVEVVLRAPPPLARELSLERDGQEARLVDGDTVVAVARSAEGSADVPADAPPPLGWDRVQAAADSFDGDAYRRGHEYPTCFTCGPDRAAGDGLRIFPGSTSRPGWHVWPWTPDGSLFDEAGEMDVAVVWAALDCPSGLAWLSADPDLGAVVLGRMAAVVNRLPEPGERLEVAGWTEEPDGRRRPARSALYSEAGDVVAASRATWVVLTEEQRRAFRSGA